MFVKSLVKLVIIKIEISIDFKVGLKQGNSMAPVLFLFLIMAFDETLEDKWTDLGLGKSQFARKYNSPRSTRQLVSHQPGTFLSGTLFDLFCMLYVDDGTFFLNTGPSLNEGSPSYLNTSLGLSLKCVSGQCLTGRPERLTHRP